MSGENGAGCCHLLLMTYCNLVTLVAGVRLLWHIPMPPGTFKLPPNPVLKGVMECLLSLEADQTSGPLSVLLGVEAVVGQVKENWSSDSLSWQLWDEAQKTMEGSSRWDSFSAHMAESFCGGDAVHFCRDLLLSLSLWDLSVLG